MNSCLLRRLALVIAIVVLGAACGDDDDSASEQGTKTENTADASATAVPGPDTPASLMRTTFDGLFQEHVFLAASATNAALGERTDEFNAATRALDANSMALAAQVEGVLGKDVGDSFLGLWRNYIGFFVSYTQGVTANDTAKKNMAVDELLLYATEDFGGFIHSTLPAVPPSAVAELVKTYVLGLKDVIDAQAAKDQNNAYVSLRAAAGHMSSVAKGLAVGVAEKFPDKFMGDPRSKAATLLDTLAAALREHVFLASAATGAALGERTDEFTAAAAALSGNSKDLIASVGGLYGPQAGQFGPLWEKHIGFVVEYATGLASGDAAKSDKAVSDLTQYSKDFGAFLNAASPKLAADQVTALIETHIATLKAVIDAQAARDPSKTYSSLRPASEHMFMIAKPWSVAVVDQFPDKFAA